MWLGRQQSEFENIRDTLTYRSEQASLLPLLLQAINFISDLLLAIFLPLSISLCLNGHFLLHRNHLILMFFCSLFSFSGINLCLFSFLLVYSIISFLVALYTSIIPVLLIDVTIPFVLLPLFILSC